VSTGFKPGTLENFNSFVELDGVNRIITGSDLERLFRGRTSGSLFEKPPSAMYCSKVCCSYSTRAAKVIRQLYPECDIVFFYMELQMVKEGDYFKELKDLGVEFIKCRPVHIDGRNGIVEYDDPDSGKRSERGFDVVVLSDGIHPNADADSVAEIFGLCQDETGFLKYTTGLSETKESGVFVAGCAAGPKKIEDVFAESASVVREIVLG
jgi:heterodisulfide reductase subunit A